MSLLSTLGYEEPPDESPSETDALQHAQNAQEIIDALSHRVNEPTPDALVDYFQDEHAEAVWTALNEHSKKLMDECHAFMRKRAQEICDSIPKNAPPNDWTDEQFTAYLYQRNETRIDPNYFIMHLSNDELENQYSKYSQEALLVLKAQTIFQEDTAHAIEALHHAWKIARELDNSIKHPLAPTIRAWLIEQTAKPISREYERTHPGATLPEKSMASVRHPLYSYTDEATTAAIEVPEAGQLLLSIFERKMYLPEFLPIQIVKGIDVTARRGVLPYVMRFFFEVGMSLPPKKRKGYYTKTLYDAAGDIGIVDPDSDKESKKYLKASMKQAIGNAIETLNLIRIPYREKVGGVGLWLPFRPQNIPTRLSEKDFPVRVWIEMPPDDKRAVLVVKTIIRELYHNNAQLNAYLAACAIFNKYGIAPAGKMMDPTEPDPNTPRLETGQLINPSTHQPMFTRTGKAITDPYHEEAFDILKPYRVYRREADNYPTLEEEEIMRAVYPHEPWKKDRQPKRWAKKAFEAWEAIAEKGYIRIIHKRTGMQILPSDSHVRLHHAILKSSEKAQR